MNIGEIETLTARRMTENGMYFTDEAGTEVLLPKNEVDGTMNIGDRVPLFLYRDGEDRPVATKWTPKLTLGKLARLKVVAVTRIGAFLDWGLEKDLFMPFREHTGTVAENQTHLVALYLDKSSRLCATMRVYPYLSSAKRYAPGTKLMASVYHVDQEKGALVALEDAYYGFIPAHEVVGKICPGDEVAVRVLFRREDGKHNVTMRKPMLAERSDDAEELMRLMDEWSGDLLVTEKDSPEKIRRVCGMSKAAFKRAVGKLLKERKIVIESDGTIRRK
ncbi:MAG: S1-like domain-containing RNA-binding protein [Eubacteriales bacterium]|nr:S1-like domain-containing RNA-binding protein [Eubacteriales bacterium]